MISLVYTRDFQIKLLINMLSDSKFFEDVCHNVHLADFDLTACRLIFEVAREYFDKYQKVPPFDILTLQVERALHGFNTEYETTLQDGEYESLAGVLGMLARNKPEDLSVAYFRDELRGYLSHVRFAQAEERAQPAEQRIAEIVKMNEDLQRVNSDDIIFMNATKRSVEENINGEVHIGTGVHAIDNCINGGLLRKQIAMLVACTGVGKTCGMINFAANNAIRGYLSLFITLENPGKMIRDRYLGILANVDADWLGKGSELWTPDVVWRMNYANSDSFRFADNVTIADCTLRAHSLADIERIIIKWKTMMIEKYGYSEDLCCLVFVDWLEKISAEGLHGLNRTTNEAKVLQLLLEALGEIARRHNVIIWTAMQGTRDAQGREVLDIKHTAHSIHAHDPLDLSIGLAPVVRVVAGVDSAYITPNEDNSKQPPCDRRLNASFMKSRQAAVAGKYTSFYQGPTLRFWDKKDHADMAARYSKQCDMESVYRIMGVPTKQTGL